MYFIFQSLNWKFSICTPGEAQGKIPWDIPWLLSPIKKHMFITILEKSSTKWTYDIFSVESIWNEKTAQRIFKWLVWQNKSLSYILITSSNNMRSDKRRGLCTMQGKQRISSTLFRLLAKPWYYTILNMHLFLFYPKKKIHLLSTNCLKYTLHFLEIQTKKKWFLPLTALVTNSVN